MFEESEFRVVKFQVFGSKHWWEGRKSIDGILVSIVCPTQLVTDLCTHHPYLGITLIQVLLLSTPARTTNIDDSILTTTILTCPLESSIRNAVWDVCTNFQTMHDGCSVVLKKQVKQCGEWATISGRL